MSEYGLLGEKLTHSFSKIVHQKLGEYSYDLLPMSVELLDEFLQKKEFKGVNVTIPYKQEVMKYCDYIDEKAMDIGAVNTIVNESGKLNGYNTDIDGFLYLLKKNNINVQGKVVYILGSGATSKTVKYALESENASEIIIVSRSTGDNKITYVQAKKDHKAEIIINTTPSGMYPNNDSKPLNLSEFNKLEAVVDVVYNPLKTRLLQQANELNLTYANGLLMLVAQAVFAAELFLKRKFDTNIIDKIYNKINSDLKNIVLVGMPSAGKSTVGWLLSKRLYRNFIDIDCVIEQRLNMKITDIFEQKGEIFFRSFESEIIAEFSKQNGLVIATGGGVLMNQNNVLNLQQNSTIIFIDRPLEKLKTGGNRPLSNNREAVLKLYEQRYPVYKSHSDITVENDGDVEQVLKAIIKFISK